MRRAVIRSRPICELCGQAAAAEVDHIQPQHRGGGNEPENLQALCRSCHRTKSALERVAAAERRHGNPEDAIPARLVQWRGMRSLDSAGDRCEHVEDDIRCGTPGLYFCAVSSDGHKAARMHELCAAGDVQGVVQLLSDRSRWTVVCDRHRRDAGPVVFSWEPLVRGCLTRRWQALWSIAAAVLERVDTRGAGSLSPELPLLRSQTRVVLRHLVECGAAETGPAPRPGRRSQAPYLWRRAAP